VGLSSSFKIIVILFERGFVVEGFRVVERWCFCFSLYMRATKRLFFPVWEIRWKRSEEGGGFMVVDRR